VGQNLIIPALPRHETYRAGADGQQKTINLLRALGSLIEDLLLVVAGTLLSSATSTSPPNSITSPGPLRPGTRLEWIDSAARALVQVEQGNEAQSPPLLSLDSMAVSLERV